jgi:signal transduction histidine kinase
LRTFRSDSDLELSKRELHDLCQPLTALRFRLEAASMVGHADALEDAVNGGLEDTRRMFAIINEMRDRLLAIQAETHS